MTESHSHLLGDGWIHELLILVAEYTDGMTTVTLQLDDTLVEETRALARARRVSMDAIVAGALKIATGNASAGTSESSREQRGRDFDLALAQFSHFETGGPYTRDALNER